jgi:hypothetical protein
VYRVCSVELSLDLSSPTLGACVHVCGVRLNSAVVVAQLWGRNSLAHLAMSPQWRHSLACACWWVSHLLCSERGVCVCVSVFNNFACSVECGILVVLFALSLS